MVAAAPGSDNIFSVRHHSAVALATVFKQAKEYQADLFARFSAHVKENLVKAKELFAQIAELRAKVSDLESELERRGRENGRT